MPNKVVLVVEDEPLARRALADLLSDAGYVVCPTACAEAAIGLLQAGVEPYAVLVDLELPGMNGLELIDRIEKDRPRTHTILLTGAPRDMFEGFQQMHPGRCLRKPVRADRLLNLLAHVPPAHPVPGR